jgi:uncharacterized OB-fold protein
VARLESLATYLPPFGKPTQRIAGPDEDAITLAVAAGRGALAGRSSPPSSVVLVSRDLPLLEGGSEAVLLAGLDLASDVRCMTVLGGATTVLDLIASAEPASLVIAADVAPAAAAAAVLIGDHDGALVELASRSERSLPVRVRDLEGKVSTYDDPRLMRERGVGVAMSHLDLDEAPVAIAGLAAKDAAGYLGTTPSPLPTTGTSSAIFALADAIRAGASGYVVAIEQASATAVRLTCGASTISQHAPDARPMPKRRETAGGDIKISLPAYERAFDGRLRLQAGQCPECATLDLPQRYRCSGCGAEGVSRLAALPREATVYTAVSIHVPVPGLLTPYDLAICELGDSGVRLLAPVTDAEPGAVAIGDAGSMVLRRVSTRNGVPDYGYAFVPDDLNRAELQNAGVAG